MEGGARSRSKGEVRPWTEMEDVWPTQIPDRPRKPNGGRERKRPTLIFTGEALANDQGAVRLVHTPRGLTQLFDSAAVKTR